MKIKFKITKFTYVNELPGYWTHNDYINLLKAFDFTDVESIHVDEIQEMLFLAISDFEPDEAARIVLDYKLSEKLNEGQIHSLSHEMLEDKVAEEYPEPDLHFDLFNINQLLYKAYNGTFPNTEASIVGIELDSQDIANVEVTNEIFTKMLSVNLSDKNIIKRLYADQIEGKEPFTDAAKFIWKLDKLADNKYELVTSRYWLEKEDLLADSCESEIQFFADAE